MCTICPGGEPCLREKTPNKAPERFVASVSDEANTLAESIRGEQDFNNASRSVLLRYVSDRIAVRFPAAFVRCRSAEVYAIGELIRSSTEASTSIASF